MTHLVIYLNSALHNTKVTVTNLEGETLFRVSGGLFSLRGAAKGSPSTALLIAERVASKIAKYFASEIIVVCSGYGHTRYTFLKKLTLSSLKPKSWLLIENVKQPHNGCRPRKKRHI